MQILPLPEEPTEKSASFLSKTPKSSLDLNKIDPENLTKNVKNSKNQKIKNVFISKKETPPIETMNIQDMVQKITNELHEKNVTKLDKMLLKQAKKSFKKNFPKEYFRGESRKEVIRTLAEEYKKILINAPLTEGPSVVLMQTVKKMAIDLVSDQEIEGEKEYGEFKVQDVQYKVFLSNEHVKFTAIDKDGKELTIIKPFNGDGFDDFQSSFMEGFKEIMDRTLDPNSQSTVHQLLSASSAIFLATTVHLRRFVGGGIRIAIRIENPKLIAQERHLFEEANKAGEHGKDVLHEGVMPHSDATIGLTSAGLALGILGILDGLMIGAQGTKKFIDNREILSLITLLKTVPDDEGILPYDTLTDVQRSMIDNLEKSIQIAFLYAILSSSEEVLSGILSVTGCAATLAGCTVAATAIGGAGGGVVIAGATVKGIFDAYKIHSYSKRIKKTKNLKQELLSKNLSGEASSAANNFLDLEKKMLKDKRILKCFHLGTDAALIVGGSLIVAAAVTGASSMGIGAGAVIGGTAVVGVGITAGVMAKKYHIKKVEAKKILVDQKNFSKALENEKLTDQEYRDKINKAFEDWKETQKEIVLVKEKLTLPHLSKIEKGNLKKILHGLELTAETETAIMQEAKNPKQLIFKSGVGKVYRLALLVQEEQAKAEGEPRPLSDHVVTEYLKMDPKIFVEAMTQFKDALLEDPTTEITFITPKSN